MARTVPDPVEQAERVVRKRLVEVAGPRGAECLPCYLQRVVSTYGCHGTLQWTHRWQGHQRTRRVRTGGLTQGLRDRGGFCDCEVLMNVYDVDPCVPEEERRPCARVC